MKKVLATAMALAMLASAVTINAGATYKDDPNHFTSDTPGLNKADAGINAYTAPDPIATQKVTVNLQTNQPGTTTNVYAVSYSITTLTFVYDMGGGKVWNPEELKYENTGTGGGWQSNGTNEIIVTNYSDLAVKVTASVSQTDMDEEGIVTVTATKKDDVSSELTLASAYNSSNPAASAATTDTFEVKVTGTPTYEYATPTKLAEITLTLSKVA